MDLIAAVTSKLGVPASVAEGAVGSVLSAIKEGAPEAAPAIDEKVPEASQWIASAPADDGDGGGLGGLGNLVGGLVGGGAGPLGALTGSLAKLGLGADSLGQLVPLVLDFLKSRVGDGVVAKILSAVPMLSQLAGGHTGEPPGLLGTLI